MAGMDQAENGCAPVNAIDDNILSRVVSTASIVFQISPDAVPLTSPIEQMPLWDSLSHLNFILALEQEFCCHFTEEEIETLTSISSVVKVLNAKQGKAS
jgi:acyl carrier protein